MSPLSGKSRLNKNQELGVSSACGLREKLAFACVKGDCTKENIQLLQYSVPCADTGNALLLRQTLMFLISCLSACLLTFT
jgi:hypothetical protein